MTIMKNRISLFTVLLFSFFHFYIFTFSSASAQRIMTLEACVEAARKGNTSAKDALNDILMAKEQKKYARSKYFPTLSASAIHFESSDYLAKYRVLEQEDVNTLNDEFGGDFSVDDFTIGILKKGTSTGISLLNYRYHI